MNNELYHYGVIGQKWGVRRYQNRDGTRTALGKKRAEREAQKSLKPNRLLLMLGNRALKQSVKLNGKLDIDDISFDKNMVLTVKNKDGSVTRGKLSSARPSSDLEAANASIIAQSIKFHNDMAHQAAVISSNSAITAMNQAMASANHASIMALNQF